MTCITNQVSVFSSIELIQVRVRPSELLPAFLWRLLQLLVLRAQVEVDARTAVSGYAIGGADLKYL